MAENSRIEWTDSTFNPWIGCCKVHIGCRLCYAEQMSKHRGWAQWGPHGTRRRTSRANWRKPRIWNNQAEVSGTRPRVFCASLADIFEDRAELAPWREELFTLIDATPHLDWQLLTKRPENVAAMWPGSQFRANCWLGTSISDQPTADEWVPRLLMLRNLAPVLWLSAEPLVGPVVLRQEWLGELDWVVVGGETGGSATRMLPPWATSLRDQCLAARIAFFFKQWGAFDAAGRRIRNRSEADHSLLGTTWHQFPTAKAEA